MPFLIPSHMRLGSDPDLAQLRARAQWNIQFRRTTWEITRAGNLLGSRLIDGTEGERLSAEEIQCQRRWLVAHKKALVHISRLSSEGRINGVVSESNRVLRSFAARASAVILDKHEKRRTAHCTEIEDRASKLNLARPCKDTVTWKGTPKHDGSTRPALSFGWRHRAQQRILRDLLLAAGVWNEFECSCATKGPHSLVQTISDAMLAGYRFWVVADIQNCFASVRPGHLRGLLPAKGAEWEELIFLSPDTPITGTNPDTFEGAARAYLPQGSMVSPRIASALIGREIRKATSGHQGVPRSFADDIGIGARTLKEAQAIKDALLERLSSLRSGPLSLKYIEIVAAVDGVDIVQRRIRLKQWDGEWKVHVQPSSNAFKRLRLSARKNFGDLEKLNEADTERLRDYIRRWAAAHDWTLQEGWVDVILESHLRDPHRLGLAELQHADTC